MILRRAILLTLLTHALPGLAAAQGVPPGLRVDRSLLPLPGAAEENIRLLEATLAGSSDPALRALLGIQHLGNRDAAAATRLCTEAMTSALTLEAPYCLALIHYYAGELEAVAAPLEQARTRAPGHPATYLLEAYAAAARGDGGAVVAALEAGQRATPDEETALWEWELLRLLDRIGDHAGAIQAAGKLIQLTPDDPGVYHAAALLEQRQGRLREAIRMELICLSKAPWHEAAARGLLTLLERDERLDEALTWADRLRISPHLTPLRDELDTTRARLAARLAETRIRALESEARVVLTEDSLRDADPAVAVPLLLGAARVLLELDLPVDRPLHLLTWGERFSPMNPEILLSLGEALLRAGRPEEAEEVAAQAGISGGDRADRRLLLARVAAVRSDTEGCLRETGAGLLLRGQDTSLLRLRASCLFAERRSEEALEALRALLRAAPGDREAQGVLVDWYRSREPSEALGILTAMHGQDPWDFRITAKAAALARDRKDADAELRWLLELARTLPPHQAARQEEALERIREILAGNRRLRQLHGGSLEGLCAGGLSGACALTELLSEPGAGRTPGTPGSSGRSAPAPRNGTAAGSAAGERLIGELERLGPDGADFLVLGLEADGFAALPVRQRIFLFLLSRAAIAGDELLYIQNHRLALPLKRLLETLWAGRGKLSLRTAAAVHDYLKYLWVNHGPYDHRSGVKFVPRFLTPRMLRAAMERLARDGEVFAFLPGQDLEERFAGIRDAIFNPTVEPRLTVTEPGQDVVAESAVNLYAPGITGAMIEALPEAWRNRLNVQYELAPSGQAAVPRTMDVTWREGARIERIIHFLRKAIPFADEGPQRASLEHLVEFYETGAEDLFNLHSVAWLRSDSATDYLNGFIEQLKDPRGVIGQFEGMAGFVSDSGMVGRLADAAAYFETRVPWPEEFRRTEVPRPVSNVIDIVCGTGDMGPVPWAGYNLPNDAELRETHGSKNVIFRNILNAGAQRDRDAHLDAFYRPEDREMVQAWGPLARDWLVYLHEIVGHGSGRAASTLKDDPRNLLGRVYSPLEEMRADLVALYFLADPKLVEIGAIPAAHHLEILTVAYLSFFQDFLASYRRFQGDVIQEAHWKGRQAILQWLLQGGSDGSGDFGIRVSDEGGSLHVRVDDVWKVRNGVSLLLQHVQVIKSTADVRAAEDLIDRYGTTYDKAWKTDAERRAERLGLSRQKAFVFPHLVPVTDAAGNITDVELRYDEDLTTQQLRFSRLQQGLELD